MYNQNGNWKIIVIVIRNSKYHGMRKGHSQVGCIKPEVTQPYKSQAWAHAYDLSQEGWGRRISLECEGSLAFLIRMPQNKTK